LAKTETKRRIHSLRVKIEKGILRIFSPLSIVTTFQLRRNSRKSQKYEEILSILSVWKKRMREMKMKRLSLKATALLQDLCLKIL